MRAVILKLNLKGSVKVELIESLGDCLDIEEQKKTKKRKAVNAILRPLVLEIRWMV